ncbi:KEOPS complex subunit [Thermococcus sp. 101 C5]|uniref:KEOPS complex subunit Pcc1 n=1 Tax=Thermococcus sp. 101 C5 TaxID=2654197 RepID=UPI00128BD3A3|nr:KEOPS complex subunit Pcc1 [Thermococcus sp. 101 C5]MPW39673.1 KEOPS complex subunit [Thermococcus sp. 101 C5]
MKIKANAEIIWGYGDESTAKAIAEAVEIDNLNLPENFKFRTYWEDGRVITKVKYLGEIESLIVALDDLVFSIKIAEDVIKK